MRFLVVVILLLVASLFIIPVKSTDAKIISPAVNSLVENSQEEVKSPQHSLASDAYQYYESNNNWYILDLEYLRDDSKRYYFGGFIALASDNNRIGKWISGSIPKKEVTLLDQEFAIPETVY